MTDRKSTPSTLTLADDDEARDAGSRDEPAALAPASALDALLSRDEILSLDDREYEVFPVKAWKGRLVRIQSLTASERDRFENSVHVQKRDGSTRQNLTDARAKLCVLTMVDANGNKIFAETDVSKLGRRNAAAINEIFEHTSKLSGILKEDLDELVGNLSSTATDAS